MGLIITADVGDSPYKTDVHSEFNSDAGRDDKDDGRNGTQFDAEKSHQTKQLQDYHSKHYNLHTAITRSHNVTVSILIHS